MERLAFVCGKNVWSSVALVEVRVMMAVTMYIFETLFVLHGVRGDCSGFASSCAQCYGFFPRAPAKGSS